MTDVNLSGLSDRASLIGNSLDTVLGWLDEAGYGSSDPVIRELTWDMEQSFILSAKLLDMASGIVE